LTTTVTWFKKCRI